MEILLSVALLAIFAVFIMEFLTNMWLASEKDFSRIKCVVAAENILEMAGGLAIAKGSNSLEDTYKRILSNDFVSPSPPEIDVATWTLIDNRSIIHPDGVGNYMVRIATEANSVGTYSLFAGDVSLANVIEIKSAYSSQSMVIDFGLVP